MAVSPDYRLAPHDHFPAPVEDCKAAVRWLRANAAKYKIDPDHIGAVGFASGGHLACMLGVTDKDDGLEGTGGNADQSSRVQAVVSFFGPTDLAAQGLGPGRGRRSNLIPLFGGTADERPEAYRKASPLTYAGKNAAPLLIFHGDKDKMVPVGAIAEAGRKDRRGRRLRPLFVVEGEGHGFRPEKLLQCIVQMMTFFDKQLTSHDLDDSVRTGVPRPPRKSRRWSGVAFGLLSASRPSATAVTSATTTTNCPSSGRTQRNQSSARDPASGTGVRGINEGGALRRLKARCVPLLRGSSLNDPGAAPRPGLGWGRGPAGPLGGVLRHHSLFAVAAWRLRPATLDLRVVGAAEAADRHDAARPRVQNIGRIPNFQGLRQRLGQFVGVVRGHDQRLARLDGAAPTERLQKAAGSRLLLLHHRGAKVFLDGQRILSAGTATCCNPRRR